MAMFATKVTVCMFITMMVMMMMGSTRVQGVPLSFGNVLSPVKTLTVRCLKDGKDAGTVTVLSDKEYKTFIPTGFYGKYVCDFSANGKRTTTFDVLNSRCKCDSFYGCDWVARNDGFYCNHGFIFRWA